MGFLTAWATNRVAAKVQAISSAWIRKPLTALIVVLNMLVGFNECFIWLLVVAMIGIMFWHAFFQLKTGNMEEDLANLKVTFRWVEEYHMAVVFIVQIYLLGRREPTFLAMWRGKRTE